MTNQTNHPEQQDLETIVANQPSKKKIGIVDTAGNITYSLLVGTVLDYCAGLNCAGIVASRASATAMNLVTGGPYGWWREQAYRATKTTKESGKVRKTIVDLLAFNTFQVPVYTTAVTIGSFISNLLQGEVKLDWNKVQDGATYLATISPIIGPTMGFYLDYFRRLFGVRSAAEGAYNKNESM